MGSNLEREGTFFRVVNFFTHMPTSIIILSLWLQVICLSSGITKRNFKKFSRSSSDREADFVLGSPKGIYHDHRKFHYILA